MDSFPYMYQCWYWTLPLKEGETIEWERFCFDWAFAVMSHFGGACRVIFGLCPDEGRWRGKTNTESRGERAGMSKNYKVSSDRQQQQWGVVTVSLLTSCPHSSLNSSRVSDPHLMWKQIPHLLLFSESLAVIVSLPVNQRRSLDQLRPWPMRIWEETHSRNIKHHHI